METLTLMHDSLIWRDFSEDMEGLTELISSQVNFHPFNLFLWLLLLYWQFLNQVTASFGSILYYFSLVLVLRILIMMVTLMHLQSFCPTSYSPLEGSFVVKSSTPYVFWIDEHGDIHFSNDKNIIMDNWKINFMKKCMAISIN